MSKFKQIIATVLIFLSTFMFVGQEAVKAYTINQIVRDIDVNIIKDLAYEKELEIVNKSTNSNFTIIIEHDSMRIIYKANEKIEYDLSSRIEFIKDFSVEDLSEVIKNSGQEEIQKFLDDHIKEIQSNTDIDNIEPDKYSGNIVAIGYFILATVFTLTAIAAIQVELQRLESSIGTSTYNNIMNSIRKLREGFNISADSTDVESGYSGNLDGKTFGKNATKHVSETTARAFIENIKQEGSKNNLQSYCSTKNRDIMMVYDIDFALRGTFNRHLGMFQGNPIARGPYAAYPTTSNFNFNGFSIFIIYNASTNTIKHIHAFPTNKKAKELEYNRYLGDFDVQFFPIIKYDPKYSSSFPTNVKTERDNQLIPDENGMNSIVPLN